MVDNQYINISGEAWPISINRMRELAPVFDGLVTTNNKEIARQMKPYPYSKIPKEQLKNMNIKTLED